MALTFVFRATPSEHARALAAMLRRKRIYWVTVGVLVVVAVGMPVFALLLGHAIADALSASLPYLVLIAILILAVPLIQRWSLRRLYRATPTYQQEQTHEFSEAGFRMTNPLSNSMVRWDAFVEVVETREFFLLYFSKSMAYFLPKRAIPSAGQLQELRTLLWQELTRVGRVLRLLAA